MKKVFISYKFTGEILEELQISMGQLTQALRQKGYKVFCGVESEQMYKESQFTVAKIMEHSLSELDRSEVMFVFNNSDSRSEGMLIEMGYAFAKKTPIILAARKGININSSKGVATKLIEFESVEDLLQQIKELDL